MKINTRGTPEERFWKKVSKKGINECWNWKALKDEKSYGQIAINKKNVLVHRFSYILHRGKIPKGMCVCHSCDNRICCNPKHLFLGTHLDNTRDMIKKGRSKLFGKAEDNLRAKLNWEEVREIRKMYKSGKYTQIRIAHLYGIAESVINSILRNKIWKKQ